MVAGEQAENPRLKIWLNADAVVFDVENYDNGGLHSTVTNNTRFTVNATGIWQIGATVEFDYIAAGGSRQVGYSINGAARYYLTDLQANIVSGFQTIINFTDNINLTSGDYVEIYVYSAAFGSNATIAAGLASGYVQFITS